MRIVRWEATDGTHVGSLVDDEFVCDIGAERGMTALAVAALDQQSGPLIALADIDLLAPLIPGKIVAVGLNYRDHAEETGLKIPDRPLLFAKFPSSISGPRSDIEMLPETTQLDYEAELGVVIGRHTRNASQDDALGSVVGYVAANDVSARDAQFADEQWVRGKSFDTFAPIGPYLVTADEVTDPGCLNVTSYVNGELRQSSNTKHLIFDIATLIVYISRYITLNPGDLILTGTPGGVGLSFTPPRYLSIGDEVVVEVEGIGALRNRVAAAAR